MGKFIVTRAKAGESFVACRGKTWSVPQMQKTLSALRKPKSSSSDYDEDEEIQRETEEDQEEEAEEGKEKDRKGDKRKKETIKGKISIDKKEYEEIKNR